MKFKKKVQKNVELAFKSFLGENLAKSLTGEAISFAGY